MSRRTKSCCFQPRLFGKGRPEDGELAHLVAHLEGFVGAGSEGVPDSGRDSLSRNVDHTQEEELSAFCKLYNMEIWFCDLDPPVTALLDGQGWELEKVCILEGSSLCGLEGSGGRLSLPL